MSLSDYQNFETELLVQLKNENKKYLKTIEDNSKLVEYYLNSKDLTHVKQFVKSFNNTVLDPNIKKYKYFEAVLNDKLFTTVLAEFRESDVLIQACKKAKRVPKDYQASPKSVNKEAIKWLLTMGINYGVQDDSGKTALMYAMQTEDLSFVVKEIMSTNGKHIQLLDNNGNNALFYATETINTLDKYQKYAEMFNPNHLNNDNENIILYSCRYNNMKISVDYLKKIMKYNCTEPNVMNREGMTALMYLVDHCYVNGVPDIIKAFIKEFNIDPNEKNKFGNSLLSVFIDSYYRFYSKCIVETKGFPLNMAYFKRYAMTLQILIKRGCKPTPEELETIAVVLNKLKDTTTSKYLLDKNYVEMLVDKSSEKSKKYVEIDTSNPEVEKNVKMTQKWLNEVYFTDGMINTGTWGALLWGYSQ